MGSTSSKDNDSNPQDLGTTTQSHQYPLHHHPHYGHDQSAQDGNVNQTGQRNSEGKNDNFVNRTSEAMEVDQQSSPDLSYLDSSLSSTQTSTHEGSRSRALVSKDDVIPMVFRWEHGGRNVYITGTFNGWSKQCPMHRSGNDFTYIANLNRGKHAYKFVVDDEWRFAPDQLTIADVDGNVNNFVDVSDFTPLSDLEKDKDKDDSGDHLYGRFIPDIDEYTKEPPPLPPHLRHIILNKVGAIYSCI
jgi:hypothetical protein